MARLRCKDASGQAIDVSDKFRHLRRAVEKEVLQQTLAVMLANSSTTVERHGPMRHIVVFLLDNLFGSLLYELLL